MKNPVAASTELCPGFSPRELLRRSTRVKTTTNASNTLAGHLRWRQRLCSFGTSSAHQSMAPHLLSSGKMKIIARWRRRRNCSEWIMSQWYCLCSDSILLASVTSIRANTARFSLALSSVILLKNDKSLTSSFRSLNNLGGLWKLAIRTGIACLRLRLLMFWTPTKTRLSAFKAW